MALPWLYASIVRSASPSPIDASSIVYVVIGVQAGSGHDSTTECPLFVSASDQKRVVACTATP